MERLILLAPIALAGCQTTATIITPPDDLRTCASEPDAPSLPERDGTNEVARDTLVLNYILALRSAYGDCASKVAGLDAWIDGVE